MFGLVATICHNVDTYPKTAAAKECGQYGTCLCVCVCVCGQVVDVVGGSGISPHSICTLIIQYLPTYVNGRLTLSLFIHSVDGDGVVAMGASGC